MAGLGLKAPVKFSTGFPHTLWFTFFNQDTTLPWPLMVIHMNCFKMGKKNLSYALHRSSSNRTAAAPSSGLCSENWWPWPWFNTSPLRSHQQRVGVFLRTSSNCDGEIDTVTPPIYAAVRNVTSQKHPGWDSQSKSYFKGHILSGDVCQPTWDDLKLGCTSVPFGWWLEGFQDLAPPCKAMLTRDL